MKCDYCKNGHYPVCSSVKERLPGGFAEYILVPESLIENGTYLLPQNITYDQSTIIEPLACCVRAQQLAGVHKNQTVMVLGSGMSGLLHVKLAKAKHCRVIATDINRKRLEFADRMGADFTINAAENVPEQLVAKNTRLADIVILCTSAIPAVDQAWKCVDKGGVIVFFAVPHPDKKVTIPINDFWTREAVDQAWKCVDKGGVIVFFAVPHPDKKVTIPINDFWTRETRIITSYYCGPPDIVAAINLIESETIKVDDMITRRLALQDIAKGFQMVTEGKESIKVIIKPNL
jgi:L-iditol 2-dehydrogenase